MFSICSIIDIIIFWVRGLCMCEYEMKCREVKILSVCMCVMIFQCV